MVAMLVRHGLLPDDAVLIGPPAVLGPAVLIGLPAVLIVFVGSRLEDSSLA